MTIERTEREHWLAKTKTEILPPGHIETEHLFLIGASIELKVTSPDQIIITIIGGNGGSGFRFKPRVLNKTQINEPEALGQFSRGSKFSVTGNKAEIKWKPHE